MNNHPVFDSIREILRQGDTGKALQMLIAYLEKDGTQPEFLRTILVVEANYNAARQKEIKGILEFSEAQTVYARSNDALLSALEDLKAGKKPSPGISGTGDGGTNKLGWIIGGSVLLLIGLVAGLLLMNQPEPGIVQRSDDNQSTGNKLQCPNFRPERFKVLILAFQNLGDQKRKPELSIQSRIRELTSNNALPADVEILSNQQLENSTPDIADATDFGRQCSADMVIWGHFESLAEEGISVDIRYAFTDDKWPPGEASQTFKNVSEIKAGRMKIDNLDEAVFRICTAVAAHENRMDLVEKWLNQLQNPNGREQAWKEILKKK